ncbi:uncharacterized protein LOC62_07G009139 [Vanrija pseudolonga]|uniref:Uncharacterized protein n=1 Tax=Vanrija pseudolonga TaxID=143232 RepID=A0AAF0YFW8_9TREE|nr:hypothetical protein LOC62_07G009139 [Vanrija pseudolonga]
MGNNGAQAFYLLVAAGALLVVYTWIILPAPALQNSGLKSAACLQQPGARAYAWLSLKANVSLCVLNSVFRAVKQTEPGTVLASYFGAFLTSGVFIGTYESFRPRGRGLWAWAARGASLAFLAGQVVTAAVSTPLYFALVAAATPAPLFKRTKSGDVLVEPRARPATEQVWAVLISTWVGFIAPFVHAKVTNFDFHALALWQPFPLYVLALNLVLPSLLRPLVGKASPNLPIVLIALGGVYASASVHLKYVWHLANLESGALKAVRDAFLLYPLSEWAPDWASNLPTLAHAIFGADFAFVFLANAAHVILGFEPGLDEAVALAVNLLLGSALLGPGAAVILLWAYGELTAKATLVASGKGQAKGKGKAE